MRTKIKILCSPNTLTINPLGNRLLLGGRSDGLFEQVAPDFLVARDLVGTTKTRSLALSKIITTGFTVSHSSALWVHYGASAPEVVHLTSQLRRRSGHYFIQHWGKVPDFFLSDNLSVPTAKPEYALVQCMQDFNEAPARRALKLALSHYLDQKLLQAALISRSHTPHIARAYTRLSQYQLIGGQLKDY